LGRIPETEDIFVAQVVYRTCTLCEACCGIEVRVDDGRVSAISGDQLDPASLGYICAKARALKDLHEDADRLRQPIRRTATGWERVGWNEAFAYAAEGILAVQRAHGNDAAAIYFGEPVVHNLGALLFGDTLVTALGTKKRFSANSLDQFPKQLVSHWMYGSGFFVSVPDVDRTDYMLIIGANPVVSNGSLMTAPGMPARLRRIQQRGGAVVVIDPRRTETARLADEHHFIRPGTDPLLLAALIQSLFAEDRIRMEALASFVDGLGAVEQAVAGFTPEAVSEHVGIGSETIRAIAHAFSNACSAVCYGRMGTSTVPFGTTTNWLIEVLNIVSGNFNRRGGAMFPMPPVDVTSLQPPTQRGRWRSRTRGTPEFMGELPAATLAEEIEKLGDGQVRALITLAGNPVLSSPAGHRLSEALRKLDFMVSIDFYLNETTRHANLILPPVGPLERDHFDVAFQLFSVRNTAHWSPAVFDPPPGTRSDADILLALASRLLWKRGGSARLQALALRALLALGSARASRIVLDFALRAGPYGNGRRPWRPGLTLKRLRQAAHGIDLGPLKRCLPDKLPTRSDRKERRIDLAPREIVADMQRLRERFALSLARTESRGDATSALSGVERGSDPADPKARASLVLIGRREARTVNSWSHNLPSLVTGPTRCVLYIHPADAEAHGIGPGDWVRVSSRVGAVEVPARITDGVMPGVVALPHGYGHGRDGIRLQVATEHPGASMNDLIDPAEIDPLSGNAVLSGVQVRVERCPRVS
jgi:anaerobic selenocysteine-containing dehydrogenase